MKLVGEGLFPLLCYLGLCPGVAVRDCFVFRSPGQPVGFSRCRSVGFRFGPAGSACRNPIPKTLSNLRTEEVPETIGYLTRVLLVWSMVCYNEPIELVFYSAEIGRALLIVPRWLAG